MDRDLGEGRVGPDVAFSVPARGTDYVRAFVGAITIGFAGEFVATVAIIVAEPPLLLTSLGILFLFAGAATTAGGTFAITRGRLGPAPIRVAMTSRAVCFEYSSGRVVEFAWGRPAFRLLVTDVYGPWNGPNNPTLSHKFWLDPPRGQSFEVPESFFSEVLDRALQAHLSIQAIETRRMPRDLRTEYRIHSS